MENLPKFYRMFNAQMSLTKTVCADEVEHHQKSGWKTLFECTWAGTFVKL